MSKDPFEVADYSPIVGIRWVQDENGKRTLMFRRENGKSWQPVPVDLETPALEPYKYVTFYGPTEKM